MPVKSKPLTAVELQIIERDRAAAREKFAHHINDDGEPSGTFDPITHR